MPDRSRDQYQGILLPDVRLRDPSVALWTDESTITQQGSRPGVPAALDQTEMVLEAAGTQKAGSEVYTWCVRGGMPGRSGRSGAFAWKTKGDVDALHRGWEGPATTSAYEAVDWVTAANTGYTQPHIVTLATPAYRDRVVAVGSGPSNIKAFWRDPDTGAISSAVVDTTDLASAHPCLVEIGERLYCLYWVRGLSSASTALYVRVSVSTDGGATWAIARAFATVESDIVESSPAAGEYTAGRLRAVEADGQVLVVARLYDKDITANSAEAFRQYASSDLTTSLVTRETWDPSASEGGQFDLAVVGGRFVVAYVAVDGKLYWRVLGSAYSPLSTAAASEVGAWAFELAETAVGPGGGTSEIVDDADIALCTDDADILWLFARFAKVGGAGGFEAQCVVVYSDDAANSWQVWGLHNTVTGRDRPARWWEAEDVSHHPQDFAATWQRGRAVLTGNVDTTGTIGETLWFGYLGGYHNLTLPPVREGIRLGDRASWDHSSWPLRLAASSGAWANTATGVNSNSLGATGETITTGDGVGGNGNFYNDHTDTVTGDIGMQATWAVEASGVSSTAQSFVGVRVRLDDGATGVEVSVNVSASGIEVIDEVAAASLLTVTGLAEADREYRLGVYKEEGAAVKSVQLAYRNTDTSEDKVWIFTGGPRSLASDAGPVGNNFIRFGNIASGGGGTQHVSRWGFGPPRFTFANISTLHQNVGAAHWWWEWAALADNPANLSGRNYSGHEVYVAEGVTVRGVDGPAMRGERHKIATRYDSPIERIFPRYSRSPRVPWRSVDDTAQEEIALQFDATLSGTTDSHVGSPVVGLALLNTNIRTGTIEYRDASGGSWTTAATFDLADGLKPIAYTRMGASIVPNGDESLSFAAQELAGWDVRTIGAGAVVRRIQSQSPGRWATGVTAGPRVRLHLSGMDGTEPASGTLALCPRNAVVLWHHDPSIDAAGWRLVIPVQDTVEGHYEIGAVVLGPVHIAGQAPAWGHSTTLEQGWTREETPGRHGVVHRSAPPRRIVEVPWPDGVDSTDFRSAAEPSWVSTTDTATIEGAAQTGATAYDLQSIVAEAQGDPVVYLPAIPKSDGSGDTIILNRRAQLVYGTIEGEIERSAILGDEWATEVHTISRVTIREEV